MKYLCTLLAFLVLTLSVQPVCASIGASASCCNERSCNEAEDEGCEEESQKDCTSGCNPFQLCGCCAFSIVPAFQPDFVSLSSFSFIKSDWLIFDCPFIEAPVLGFWQPPKLS